MYAILNKKKQIRSSPMKEKYKRIRKELFALNPRFRKLQTRAFLRLFLKILFWELLMAAFTVGTYVITPGGALTFPIIGILSVAVILKKSKFWKWRTFGEVTNIARTSRMYPLKAYFGAVREKQVSIFTVTDAHGTTMEIELDICYERVFKKGDKLIRLSGMQYPVDLTPEDILICPFCGNVFPSENDVCVQCGEPAIRAEITDDILLD